MAELEGEKDAPWRRLHANIFQCLSARATRTKLLVTGATGKTSAPTGTAQLLVGPEHTAPFVGSGRIVVLATPVMINVIEAAALNAVEHILPAGHQSMGIRLDVSDVAATPVGLRVTATATVLGVVGGTITFRVEARDEG